VLIDRLEAGAHRVHREHEGIRLVSQVVITEISI
jgi:hypothetical protein